MTKPSLACLLAMSGLAALAAGCAGHAPNQAGRDSAGMVYDRVVATQIEYPDLRDPCRCALEESPPPVSILSPAPPTYWDMPLDEAIQTALAHSAVLRDLDGLVLRSPAAVRTIHGPAIQETDPRFGVEAALSDFDARVSSSAFFENNDRALNNSFFGGGTRLLKQDLAVFRNEITKRTATGTQFTIRNNTDYDANNAPGNFFPSAWNTNFEGEFRQPLLQGAGVEFNRIAGPNGVAGVPNGVLIARVNTDVSLAEFEIGVRNVVSDVENAYWDLYLAYRDLDAKVAARNSALELWRRINALYVVGRRGGEAEKEAAAREQYFRFEEEVQNTLTGTLMEGTRTNSGSAGGTLHSTNGVHVTERRLRLMLGLPANDGRLIRPADEPVMAKVLFDWHAILVEALARRTELRRQQWLVKHRELELVASRNYLKPNLDAVGRYRFRGFGHDLLDPDGNSSMRFDNAFEDLTTGDFQEWQLGFEFGVPLGSRRGHATVRNAQLQLARERAVLCEQEREVLQGLSNAVADVDRAYVVAQTNFNRRLAARQQLQAVEATNESERSPEQLALELEAQRRLSDAESRYFRSLVEYALAVKNVHFEKGSLLDFNEIYLAEGPWPGKAYRDAAERESARRRAPLSFLLDRMPLISDGPQPQQIIAPPFGPPVEAPAHSGPQENTAPQENANPPARRLPVYNYPAAADGAPVEPDAPPVASAQRPSTHSDPQRFVEQPAGPDQQSWQPAPRRKPLFSLPQWFNAPPVASQPSEPESSSLDSESAEMAVYPQQDQGPSQPDPSWEEEGPRFGVQAGYEEESTVGSDDIPYLPPPVDAARALPVNLRPECPLQLRR